MYHYEQADGSIIKTLYLIGARSLAVGAVSTAIPYHPSITVLTDDIRFDAHSERVTGVYFPVKGEFSVEEVGQQTQLARSGAAAGLEGTPHRFGALVSVARSQVPSFLQDRALQIQEAGGDAERNKSTRLDVMECSW